MKYVNARGRTIAIALISVVVLIVLVYSFPKGCQRDQNPPPPGNRAQANLVVAFRGDSVILRNDDHFDWTNTKISLQHGDRMYYYQAGTIDKGATKGFLMEHFISPEGEPFNHKKYKPEKVSITANEADGTVLITP